MIHNTIFSRIVTFFFLAITMLSCFQKKPDVLSDDIINESNIPDSLLQKMNADERISDIDGKYKGTLPCTDCDGVMTEIILNEDKTYVKSISQIGKSDTAQTEEGKWNRQGNIINLRNQLNAFQMYFVGENYLQQLDSAGRKIKGELAEQYILKKEINL